MKKTIEDGRISIENEYDNKHKGFESAMFAAYNLAFHAGALGHLTTTRVYKNTKSVETTVHFTETALPILSAAYGYSRKELISFPSWNKYQKKAQRIRIATYYFNYE